MNNALRFCVLTIGSLLFWVACQSSPPHSANNTTNALTSNIKIDGQRIFRTNCAMCHGRKGKLGLAGAAKLHKSTLPKEEIITIISKGKGKMTGFKHVLQVAEIEAVANYILTLRQS